MANYLIYPFRTMRITQSYTGTTSHLPHSSGTPKDYPLDEGGADGGRDWVCCPCDGMKVVKTYGVGNGGANTVWLTSTSKVIFADGSSDYVTIMCIHPEDADLKGKTGKIFKRYEQMFREGGDGGTVNGKHVQYGNHIHMAVGKGTITGTGWTKNSKGKWVLTTTGGTIKPEAAFAIDESFTKRVVVNMGLKFKTLAAVKKAHEKPATVKYTTGTYEVTVDVLHVRKGPGVNFDALTFKQLTKSAQKEIKKLCGKEANGYVKGLQFTCKKVNGSWGETPSGWVSLSYCKKV